MTHDELVRLLRNRQDTLVAAALDLAAVDRLDKYRKLLWAAARLLERESGFDIPYRQSVAAEILEETK